MGMRAGIFLQRTVDIGKQQHVCWRYCLTQHWSFLTYIRWWAPEEAAALVHSGQLDVIVAAYESKAVHQMVADIGRPGVVLVVHPEAKFLDPPRGEVGRFGELIDRWFRRGKTVREIALDLDSETTDVRRVLRTYGHRLPPKT